MTLAELIDQKHPFEVPVVTANAMERMKIAVYDGYVVYASPAITSLLKDDSSIEQVAKTVRVVIIPRFDPVLPMTIKP